MTLYLFLISQNKNNNYDTYDSAVVCAESKEEAQLIHPGKGYRDVSLWIEKMKEYENLSAAEKNSYMFGYSKSWVNDYHDVTVKQIGIADDGIPSRSVIITSFNSS